jgi:hypothetical protein
VGGVELTAHSAALEQSAFTVIRVAILERFHLFSKILKKFLLNS